MQHKSPDSQLDQSTSARTFPINCKFLYKWLKFTKFNKFLEKVDILPLKCPLKPEFDSYLLEEERFPFQQVFEFSVKSEKPITDIIDLTNVNNKYYDPKAEGFLPSSIQYHQFPIAGKELPYEVTLVSILDLIEKLLKEKKVIGIHCTHGLNRTGFIVCTFLVRKMGWDPASAISEFQKARGHEISYSEYIRAIQIPEGSYCQIKIPTYRKGEGYWKKTQIGNGSQKSNDEISFYFAGKQIEKEDKSSEKEHQNQPLSSIQAEINGINYVKSKESHEKDGQGVEGNSIENEGAVLKQEQENLIVKD